MAGSNDDATSSGTLETADKLTDVEKMKEALEKLCHDEVNKVRSIYIYRKHVKLFHSILKRIPRLELSCKL